MRPLESLRGRKIFRAIRGDGSVFDGEILKVFYVFRSNPHTRLQIAVVVNKRHGAAVHRNLIKRRIRESFRLEIGKQAKRLERTCIVISAVVAYKGTKQPRPSGVSFEDIRRNVEKFIEVIPSVRK